MRPVSGNTGIATAKSSTKASAQMKSGTASKMLFKPSITVSPAVRRISVPATAIAAAQNDRDEEREDGKLEVAGSRDASTSVTYRCNVIEVPKSPVTTPFIQIQNWVSSGASSP